MNSMKKALVALWKEEEGLTMVEYAVAGGLICAAAVAAFTSLGQDVAAVITYIGGVLAGTPAG